MKRLKLIASILTLIALLLCSWSIYELNSENGNIVQASLNLVYFLTLFITFLCIRISIWISRNVKPVTLLISTVIIPLSTYTWIDAVELLVLGKYILGLLPILIGTTLMFSVKSDSKWSKFVQIGIGVVAISLSVCVFTGVYGTSIYTLLFFGMILLTVAVLGYSFLVKTT